MKGVFCGGGSRVSRAQASVETMLLLGIALFIIGAFATIIFDQINSSYVQQQQKMGSQSLRTLAKEIDDAYFLGPGSVKTVQVHIPELTDFSNSYMQGKSLVLNIAGTDFIASTKVPLSGAWPNSDGAYEFVITAFENFVSIAVQKLSFSPNQLTVSLRQGSSSAFNLVVDNVGGEPASYDFSIVFEGADAAVSSGQAGVLSFEEGESKSLQLTAVCGSGSAGSYDGYLLFAGDYNATLPVRVVCSSQYSKLMVLPSAKTVLSGAGSVSSESFLVCNNTPAEFYSAVVSLSGEVSSYASSGFSGTLGANSCRQLDLNIHSPQSPGTYSGRLVVSASGYSAYSDLNLVVS